LVSPTRSLLALALVPVALAGCGGGTKTVTVRTQTETVTATHTTSTPSRPPAASGRASTADAGRYAHRTYVVQSGTDRRTFGVSGPATSVTAADGSTITAFGIVLADSGDGTGQAVLLFRGDEFLGWASDRLALHLSVGGEGQAIAVRYGAYRGDDPFCCPSSFVTVRYTWNGTRIVADGDPPLAYGKQGDRLRLAASG
jgi:hypothetical protein